MKTIYVIGAGIEGQEGFSRRALELVAQAELLIGGPRQLALFPDFSGTTMATGDNLAPVVECLAKCTGSAVVLASGDPLFFGIGRYLLRNLPDADLEFVPNVSSAQYAFAKIREPWDDAVFVSAQGRGLKGAVDQ
ncbi:MAG: precorrin-6y C5,15-methyltransferase (decarboxylating) subunit CbiE, partial [Desulfuromonadales bacterium]|nr:precorrin-6y C5,15-methyltransferase (decarboxylating) subunit CbiE [Desulfuromonadales bacterium]